MAGWIFLCVVLVLVIFVLSIKIIYMRKSADEIREQFAEILKNDTNAVVTLSGNDKVMRALANDINIQLKELRKQKHRYVTGDLELKNAVTNISHDLRTPLTAIRSYLELLERSEKSETVTRYLDVIGNRTEMLIGLTEELFRYSVITSPEYNMPPEMTDIKVVLEESILGFYVSFQERGITPDICLTEQKVVRSLSPAALSRVFSNILSNAVKYSDGDLKIILTDDGEISFSNMTYELSGVQVEKLFDRFYTLENAGKSTGLGLSIARILMEQMNGSIHAVYREQRLTIRLQFSE